MLLGIVLAASWASLLDPKEIARRDLGQLRLPEDRAA